MSARIYHIQSKILISTICKQNANQVILTLMAHICHMLITDEAYHAKLINSTLAYKFNKQNLSYANMTILGIILVYTKGLQMELIGIILFVRGVVTTDEIR